MEPTLTTSIDSTGLSATGSSQKDSSHAGKSAAGSAADDDGEDLLPTSKPQTGKTASHPDVRETLEAGDASTTATLSLEAKATKSATASAAASGTKRIP